MENKKKFDQEYILLEEMYSDPFFPDDLVDKIRDLIIDFIKLVENGERSKDILQRKLDEMTEAINDLEEEFFKYNSEIDDLARESIAVSLLHVLSWFNIKIDIEDALRMRNW